MLHVRSLFIYFFESEFLFHSAYNSVQRWSRKSTTYYAWACVIWLQASRLARGGVWIVVWGGRVYDVNWVSRLHSDLRVSSSRLQTARDVRSL